MRETKWGCLMSSQHPVHLPSLFLDRGHLWQTMSLEHHEEPGLGQRTSQAWVAQMTK